jgi:hypothetical protein
MRMGGVLLALSFFGLACGGSDPRARTPTEADITAADSATETDEICSKVRTSIETASAALKDLQEKARSAPLDQRQSMERAIAKANEKLLVVRRTARRIPSQHGPVWPSFKEAVARAVEDLQGAVRTASEVRVASK